TVPSPVHAESAPSVAPGSATDLGYAQHWTETPNRQDERDKDFAAAQKDLQKMFEIVKPDAIGPRLGKQVTQEEDEDICHRYSASRMGDSSLKLSDGPHPDEEEFKNTKTSGMNDIAEMMQTSVGRDLLRSFQDNPDLDHGKPIVLDSMIASPQAIFGGGHGG